MTVLQLFKGSSRFFDDCFLLSTTSLKKLFDSFFNSYWFFSIVRFVALSMQFLKFDDFSPYLEFFCEIWDFFLCSTFSWHFYASFDFFLRIIDAFIVFLLVLQFRGNFPKVWWLLQFFWVFLLQYFSSFLIDFFNYLQFRSILIIIWWLFSISETFIRIRIALYFLC